MAIGARVCVSGFEEARGSGSGNVSTGLSTASTLKKARLGQLSG